MATNTGHRAGIKTVTTQRVCASPHSIGSASWRFLPWFLLQPFMTLNTQGPPTTSTSTPGTAKESSQCDPAALTVSEIKIVYWDVYWCPITIVCRSYTINFCAENLQHMHMFLHLLCVTALSWWYVCLSGPRWPFCTMTGLFWRTIMWALPTGWWWRRIWTFLSIWTRMTGGDKEIHHAWPEAHSNHRTNNFDCIYGFFFDRELRTLVVEMVMSTDMSCHFQQIKTMKNALTQTDKLELKTTVFLKSRYLPINLTKTLILHIALHLRHIYKFAEI